MGFGKFNIIEAAIAFALISGVTLGPVRADSIDDSYYQRAMSHEPGPSGSSRPRVYRDRNYDSRRVDDSYYQTEMSTGRPVVPSRPEPNLDRNYDTRHVEDSYDQQVNSDPRRAAPPSRPSIDYGRLIPDGGFYYPMNSAPSPSVVYQYGIQPGDLPWYQRGFKEVTVSSTGNYRLKNDRMDVTLPSGQQSTAVLVVHLPPGASLQVDSKHRDVGDPHFFHTPPLGPGQYGYTFEVTLPTGQVVEKRVKFTAGEVRGIYLESAGTKSTAN